jgi:hypothetical protein
MLIFKGTCIMKLIHSLLLLLTAASVFVACDSERFVETKSNGIVIDPETLYFSPPPQGQGFTNTTISVGHTGEAPLVIDEIYLVKVNEDGTESRIEGCDRITEGISPSQVLIPEILSTCNLLITERPELPLTLDNSESKQVMLTFRPILDQPFPQSRLIIESNALDNYTSQVDLQATSGSPQLVGEPAIVFDGNNEEVANYILRNLGTAPAILTQVVIEDDPDGEFSWDLNSGTIPGLRLDEQNDNRVSFRVRYTPLDEGVDRARMSIQATTEGGEPLPEMSIILTSERVPTILEITPSPLTFEHSLGQIDQKRVQFSNTGLSNLSILSMEVSPPDVGYKVASSELTSFQLAGGDSREVTLEYTAGSDPTMATLILTTQGVDNATDNRMEVPLVASSGTGFASLSIAPPNVEFNQVSTGDSLSKTITLTSNGTDPLSITSIALDANSDPVFEIENAEALTLEPNATQEITLTFTRPADEVVANAYQGTVVIQSNGLSPETVVLLVANP